MARERHLFYKCKEGWRVSSAFIVFGNFGGTIADNHKNFRGRAAAAKVSERADEIYNQRKEVIDEGKILSMTSEQRAEYQAEVLAYNHEMRNISWDDACRELGEGKIKISLLSALKHEIQWRFFKVRKRKMMEKLRKAEEKRMPNGHSPIFHF